MRKIKSRKWFSKLSREEVEQEELIQKWQQPELIGYEGLLAYIELNNQESIKNKSESQLKKNTPANSAGVSILDIDLIEFLSEFPVEERGRVCILIQGVLKELIDGKNINSIRKLAAELKVSKSSLDRLAQSLQKHSS